MVSMMKTKSERKEGITEEVQTVHREKKPKFRSIGDLSMTYKAYVCEIY